MSHVSTHVLDTATGRPAAGVTVTLEDGDRVLARGATDADGRVTELGPDRLDPATRPVQHHAAAVAQVPGPPGAARLVGPGGNLGALLGSLRGTPAG